MNYKCKTKNLTKISEYQSYNKLKTPKKQYNNMLIEACLICFLEWKGLQLITAFILTVYQCYNSKN